MTFHMEQRKVQKTGGSSYIISLPKEWIVKNNIEKKDSLGIISQPDGNLMITPKSEKEELSRIKEINLDEINSENFLFRVLIGAYIMGFSKKIIKSSRKIESSMRDVIVNFTQIAIGPEIVEERNNFIIIKDLLNPKEMPFDKTIRRMYIIAESMHEEAITALKKKDEEMAEEVIKKDNDIDRLHWLIGRQSHIVLRDIILCQKMGITLEDANHFLQMSRLLERIGDHAVKIAKNVLLILKNDGDSKIIAEVERASKMAIKEIMSKSLAAWLEKDILLANNTIESIKNLISVCEDISNSLNSNNPEEYLAFSYIIESIRRTGEYAGDICEIIINNLVNDDVSIE